MGKSIVLTIARGAAYMEAMGYSEATINRHLKHWRSLDNFARERGRNRLSDDLFSQFEREKGLCRRRLTENQRLLKMSIGHLRHFEKHGRFQSHGPKEAFPVPAPHQEVLASYSEHLSTKDLSPRTAKTYVASAKRLLNAIGSDRDLTTLSADDIAAFLLSLGCAKSSVAQTRQSLRSFISFLNETYEMENDLSKTLSGGGRRHDEATLPSFYTADELKRLLEASTEGTTTPKRDFAMVLMCIQYGMRKNDLLRMRLESIDWSGGVIRITQSKTGLVSTYPLTKQVRLALLDYLKNERPESDEPFVFLRGVAPFTPYDCSSGALHYVITRSMRKAGLSIDERRHGPHALRHSLATQMMDDGTPYSTIASVLGHAPSAASTRRYLEMDVKRLRTMALEVPAWNM